MTAGAPSFRLAREVLNHDDIPFDVLQEKAREQIPPEVRGKVGFLRSRSGLHLIMSAVEVDTFLTNLGTDITTESVESLASFLESNLPDSSEKHLSLASFPIGSHKSLGKTGASHLTFSSADETICAERKDARRKIEAYYGLEKAEAEALWLWRDPWAGIPIASSSNRLAFKAMRRLLQDAEDILPKQIELGPLFVEDI